MKLTPLCQGVRTRWLLLLVATGVVIASLNIFSLLLLKHLWQSKWDLLLLSLFLTSSVSIFLFSLVEAFLAERLGQHYLKDVRHQLYITLMSAPDYQAPKRLGVMMTRLITDSSNIKNWASQGAAKLATHGCSTLGYLGLLITLWGNTGGLIAGIIVVVFIVTAIISPTLFNLARNIRRDRGRLSGHLCERIVSYRCVNQFRQIKREGRRLNRASDKLAKTSVNEFVLQAFLTQQTVFWLPVTLAGLIVTFVWQQDTKNEDIATLLLVLGLLFNSVREVLISWGYAITYVVAKQRLELAMSHAMAIRPHRDKRLTHNQAHSIKLKQLKMDAHSESITQVFSSGEVIKLRGWRSSERSRLCRILTGNEQPIEGGVVVSGRKLEWLNPDSISKSIIHINDNSKLFRGSILTNIRYGKRKATEKEIRRVCQVVDLSLDLLNVPVLEFGVGINSELTDKVLIARSLLLQPRLILLDRLSILNNTDLLNILENFAGSETFTLLLTHSEQTIQ